MNNDLLEKHLKPNCRISTFKVFVLFMGSHEKAAFLNQLYYWSDGRTIVEGGWIAKSYDDWFDEIVVTRRQIKAATDDLKEMGLLETKRKKWYGLSVVHYKFDRDKFELQLSKFIEEGATKKKRKPRGKTVQRKTNLSQGKTNLTETNLSKVETNLSPQPTKSYNQGKTNLSPQPTKSYHSINNDYTDTTKTMTTTDILSRNESDAQKKEEIIILEIEENPEIEIKKKVTQKKSSAKRKVNNGWTAKWLDIWNRLYKIAKQTNDDYISEPKDFRDFGRIKKKLELLYKKRNDNQLPTDEILLEWFEHFATKAMKIKWLKENYRITNLASQFNEIISFNPKESNSRHNLSNIMEELIENDKFLNQ